MSITSVWQSKSTTPGRKRGWYITRREDGDLQWRAWGCGAWWKQLKDGWMEWFNGNGEPMRFDWMPLSRQKLELNANELPEVGDFILSKLKRKSK